MTAACCCSSGGPSTEAPLDPSLASASALPLAWLTESPLLRFATPASAPPLPCLAEPPLPLSGGAPCCPSSPARSLHDSEAAFISWIRRRMDWGECSSRPRSAKLR